MYRPTLSEPRCGYVLYRSRPELGGPCEVIAPGSMPRRTVTGPAERLLDHPIPVAQEVPRAVWNTLMHAEQSRGVTRFAGAQMRYLICCDRSICVRGTGGWGGPTPSVSSICSVSSG